MKSLILLLLAITATAASAQQPQPCLKLTELRSLERALPRGGNLEVVLKFTSSNCSLITPSRPPLGQPHLETESYPGLIIHKTYSTIQPDQISANLEITAASYAKPGKYDISAHLSYKAADIQGNVMDQVLDFNVPVAVSRGFASNLPFEIRHPVWTAVLTPLAVIASIPLCLLKLLLLQGECGGS